MLRDDQRGFVNAFTCRMAPVCSFKKRIAAVLGPPFWMYYTPCVAGANARNQTFATTCFSEPPADGIFITAVCVDSSCVK